MEQCFQGTGGSLGEGRGGRRGSARVHVTPCLPGMMLGTGHAVWPVWKGSARHQVRPPTPPSRKEAQRLYYRLEAFERQTRAPGRQDGSVTRNGLAIARALLFGFLNFRTGQLDPSYGSIARKACISIRSVARGLQALKAIGFLAWVRRCSEVNRDGRYSLEQDSNLYVINHPTAWRGYTPPAEPPPPDAGTWGDHPCGQRAPLVEAAQEAEPAAMIRALEADTGDRLALALAKLGRAVHQGSGFRINRSASLT